MRDVPDALFSHQSTSPTVSSGGLTVSAGGASITGTVSGTTFSGSGASLTNIGTSNMTTVTGTPSSTTYLRGDGSWATPAASLPSLTNDYLWIGNASNVATAVQMLGDCTIANTGAITCTKTNGTSFGTLATLSAAPAGTLTGTTLASNVVSSSLTGVGTITSGVWNGTGIGIAYGGTNSTAQTTNGVNYYNGTSITSGSGFVYTGGQVGIGTSTPTATLTRLGTEAIQFGSNYTTTGTQNDVAINANGSIRYAGTGVATFNGIMAGANGQILYLHNGSTSALTLANQASADTTYANQIVTGTGSNLTVAANSAVILQYELDGDQLLRRNWRMARDRRERRQHSKRDFAKRNKRELMCRYGPRHACERYQRRSFGLRYSHAKYRWLQLRRLQTGRFHFRRNGEPLCLRKLRLSQHRQNAAKLPTRQRVHLPPTGLALGSS